MARSGSSGEPPLPNASQIGRVFGHGVGAERSAAASAAVTIQHELEALKMHFKSCCREHDLEWKEPNQKAVLAVIEEKIESFKSLQKVGHWSIAAHTEAGNGTSFPPITTAAQCPR